MESRSAAPQNPTCPVTANHVRTTRSRISRKRYFDVGDLGFDTWRAFGGTVGMCICNAPVPETYRVLGLREAELILLGYNTPSNNPDYPEMNPLVPFHNRLSMQSGAYQNGAWVGGRRQGGARRRA